MIEATSESNNLGISRGLGWHSQRERVDRKKAIDKWRRELLRLEGEGARDPENSDVAYRRWRQMRSSDGQFDYRSINTALYVFRRPALSQPKGAAMLATAIREVVRDRGEEPKREWFSGQLMVALQQAAGHEALEQRQNLHWLLDILS